MLRTSTASLDLFGMRLVLRGMFLVLSVRAVPLYYRFWMKVAVSLRRCVAPWLLG